MVIKEITNSIGEFIEVDYLMAMSNCMPQGLLSELREQLDPDLPGSLISVDDVVKPLRTHKFRNADSWEIHDLLIDAALHIRVVGIDRSDDVKCLYIGSFIIYNAVSSKECGFIPDLSVLLVMKGAMRLSITMRLHAVKFLLWACDSIRERREQDARHALILMLCGALAIWTSIGFHIGASALNEIASQLDDRGATIGDLLRQIAFDDGAVARWLDVLDEALGSDGKVGRLFRQIVASK